MRQLRSLRVTLIRIYQRTSPAADTQDRNFDGGSTGSALPLSRLMKDSFLNASAKTGMYKHVPCLDKVFRRD